MAGNAVVRLRLQGATLSLLVVLQLALGVTAAAQDGVACPSEVPEDLHADAEGEAELLNVMLLQTGFRPPRGNLDEHGHRFPWDVIWRRAKKDIKNVAGNMSQGALMVAAQEVGSALDQFDSVVTEFADKSLDAEARFVDKVNATVEQRVETVKAKVKSVMTSVRDLWKSVASKVLTVKGIIVSFCESIGEMDTAEHLSASFDTVVNTVEKALESTEKVAVDAEALTASVVSCGVVKLNSTVDTTQASAAALARHFDRAFNETNEKICGVVKERVPGFAADPVIELLGALHKRSLVSSANLFRVESDAVGRITTVLDALQAELLSVGNGCPKDGAFSRLKRFFHKVFHR